MKLYGLSISNYYNVPKLALLEKGIAFEEVITRPSQDPEYLEKSPMGKIPFLEVDGVFISETQAILAYLEAVKPEPALFPKDALALARCFQIAELIKQYIDMPARRVLGAAVFGGSATPEQIEAARADTAKGVAGLAKLTNFEHFISGDQFSFADIYALTTLPLPRLIFNKLGVADPLDELNGLAAYMERHSTRPSYQRVVTDQQNAMAAYLSQKKG